MLGGGVTWQMMEQSESLAPRLRIYLFLVDATDMKTPETGEAGGQPQISANGAAFGNTTNTLTAVGNGLYYVLLTTTEVGTVGYHVVRYKSAATCEAQTGVWVVGWDPFNAINLGLTSLPAAAAEAAGGLFTRGTGAGQINQAANGQIDANAVKIEGADPTDTIRDSVVDDATRLNASKLNTGIPEVAPGGNGGLPLLDAGLVVQANAAQISGDATAADNLETMLDGTGGKKLTLEQLVINSSSAGGAVDIDNSAGDGVSIVGGAVGDGIHSEGGAGSGIHALGGAPNGDGLNATGKGVGAGLRAGSGGTLNNDIAGDIDGDLLGSATALGAQAKADVTAAVPTAAANAAAVIDVDLAAYEAAAKSGTKLGNMLAAARAGAFGKLDLAAGTLTIYEVDGVTVIAQFTVADDYSSRTAPV